MIYKLHLAIFVAAFVLILRGGFLESDERQGGTHVVAEPMRGACEYQVVGLSKKNSPYRIVYKYERWGFEPKPVLEVTSNGTTSFHREHDSAADRDGNFYPTLGNFGLFRLQEENQDVSVEEVGQGRCKGLQLSFRANASNAYRLFELSGLFLLMYFIIFVIVAAFFEVFSESKSEPEEEY